MIEYISSTRPPVMVVRGVLHGCIGKCCGKKYPSIFANLGDKEIWNFVQETAIKIKVDNNNNNFRDPNANQRQDLIKENEKTNITGIVIGIIFATIFALGLSIFVYIRYCKNSEILRPL